MKRIRLTKLDREAVYDAIEFIETNTDSVPMDERAHYDNITDRLLRVAKRLNAMTHKP